jgi:tRNA threonylcarbamoyl adenosine modification protein (Sua5/YciO/YrdC/YwlC family)
MAQYFELHPVNPQPRLIRQAAEIVRGGGVIALPTDSSYALGCHLGDKDAHDRICRIRKFDDKHNFTLLCADLSQLAQYARIGNRDFRLLKTHTPGPYTFILPATREVPRRLQQARRKTIGLRVPDHAVVHALLAELGEPLMTVTLIVPPDTAPLSDPHEIRARLEHQVELVLDAGACSLEPTTVVVLDDGVAEVRRVGRGDPAPFQA